MRVRVLFVDDDTTILETVQRTFRATFDITVALGAEAGRAQLEQSDFDVVVSDYSMPGEDGVTFLRSVAARKPSVVRYLMTAHFADPRVVAARDAALVAAIIPKPWKRAELTSLILAAASSGFRKAQ